jgi:hypothetical protein
LQGFLWPLRVAITVIRIFVFCQIIHLRLMIKLSDFQRAYNCSRDNGLFNSIRPLEFSFRQPIK